MMCTKCGTILKKTNKRRHEEIHKKEKESKRLNYRTPEGCQTEIMFPFWTQYYDAELKIDDEWKVAPIKLLDPTVMYQGVYEMLLEGVRIPGPFVHFGVLPIWQIWNDTGTLPTLTRNPTLP